MLHSAVCHRFHSVVNFWEGKSVRGTGPQSLLPIYDFLKVATCCGELLLGNIAPARSTRRIRALRIAHPVSLNALNQVSPLELLKFFLKHPTSGHA